MESSEIQGPTHPINPGMVASICGAAGAARKSGATLLVNRTYGIPSLHFLNFKVQTAKPAINGRLRWRLAIGRRRVSDSLRVGRAPRVSPPVLLDLILSRIPSLCCIRRGCIRTRCVRFSGLWYRTRCIVRQRRLQIQVKLHLNHKLCCAIVFSPSPVLIWRDLYVNLCDNVF